MRDKAVDLVALRSLAVVVVVVIVVIGMFPPSCFQAFAGKQTGGGRATDTGNDTSQP